MKYIWKAVLAFPVISLCGNYASYGSEVIEDGKVCHDLSILELNRTLYETISYVDNCLLFFSSSSIASELMASLDYLATVDLNTMGITAFGPRYYSLHEKCKNIYVMNNNLQKILYYATKDKPSIGHEDLYAIDELTGRMQENAIILANEITDLLRLCNQSDIEIINRDLLPGYYNYFNANMFEQKKTSRDIVLLEKTGIATLWTDRGTVENIKRFSKILIFGGRTKSHKFKKYCDLIDACKHVHNLFSI
ncbi:MAG: hypothetical protein LBL18_06330 [Bacteroidales bacterium]|jgi:hypothetical protein|nr:hypothetical protein [Bacteroidales bacterium]